VAMNPKTGLLFSFLLKPRRLLLWISIALALFIFQHVLSLHQATTHIIDDNDTRPRFWYRSSFRDNPDLDYENRISNALRRIEKAELANNDGDTLAEERIWQIAKDEDQRGDDSKAFERQNRIWTYSVIL
jgi:hypothetical protein